MNLIIAEEKKLFVYLVCSGIQIFLFWLKLIQ